MLVTARAEPSALRALASAAAALALVLGCASPAPAVAASPNCTRQSGQGSPGAALETPVKLEPDLPGQVVNFGGTRGTQFVDVVLTATPALPASLTPDQIRIDVLRRFLRTSNNLRTTAAPLPTFTEPEIAPTRDRVTFTVCLSGSGLPAGSYVGNVTVDGPKGFGPASISITENAANATLALAGGAGSLIAAFAFLLLRGAASRQAAAQTAHAQSVAAAAEANNQQQLDQLHQQPPKPRLSQYFGEVVSDLNWWITTIVALGLATGTIIGLYFANPAWGASTWGSIAALVGPVFSAVGVQSVITSLGRGVAH